MKSNVKFLSLLLVPAVLLGGRSYIKKNQKRIYDERNNNETFVIEEIKFYNKDKNNKLIIEDIDYSDSTNDLFDKVKYVRATTNVNVRSFPSTDSTSYASLNAGNELEYVSTLPNGWYAVNFDNKIAYISSMYSTIVEEEVINDEYAHMAMVKEDMLLNNNFIPKYEVVELVDQVDDICMAYLDGNIYYIDKEKLEKLTGRYVVVDISDQEVKLYQDDEVIMQSPCVSGKPSSPTSIGDFRIFEISHNRNLIGPGYKSYVDVMMKFHNGQGLHDAEYHKDYDENGKLIKSHGWRNIEEFGGNTYQNHGSHGCVNMPHDAAIELSEQVSIGTRVLVKK